MFLKKEILLIQIILPIMAIEKMISVMDIELIITKLIFI